MSRTLPSGDVIGIVLRQHGDVREILASLRKANDSSLARQGLERLKATLIAQEAAERLVLRPASRDCVGVEIAPAREAEECARAVLDRVDALDPGGEDFRSALDSATRTSPSMPTRRSAKSTLSSWPGCLSRNA